MKIDKLRTSIEFGKYLDQINKTEYCHLNGIASQYITDDGILAHKYYKRQNYDRFLLSPQTKDMFVNSSPMPIEDDYKVTELGEELACYQFMKDFDKWQEAEEKVIFEDVDVIEESIIGLSKVYLNEVKIAHYWVDDTWLCLYETLHDLAEATKGELKLKNVEI